MRLWRLKAGQWLAATIVLALLYAFPVTARAVVVRGRVTTAQGVTLPGARVQLVERGKVVAVAYAGPDGAFEIRAGDAGRFTLLTFLIGYFPAIGDNFYGGASAVVLQNVVLAKNSVRAEMSTETGASLPVALAPQPATLLSDDLLSTRVDLVDELRLQPGAFVVRAGQRGAETSLSLRGGPSDANKVLLDSIAVDDLGGRFDFGTVSTTGIASVETDRGANSAVYGSDARAAVVSLRTPRGGSLRPRFLYSGDGGTLHTFRDEASIEGTRRKLDYLAEFSRFDTSNALPGDEFHASTAAANLGYALGSQTLLRGTVRNAVTANGLPGPFDFYGLAQNAKRGDQDIYAQGTLEHRSEGDWHNLLRYDVARKREEQQVFGPVGSQAANGLFFGNLVTIRGANGYSVTAAAALPTAAVTPSHTFFVSDRDELGYETDAHITKHFFALFGFTYENERGAQRPVLSATPEQTQRTNFTYNGLVQGDIKTRVFFFFAGAVEKNHLYGTRGTPQLGLTYVAVRSSDRKFHGTSVHADVSRGVQEPGLAFEFASLDRVLRAAGNTAAIAAYAIRPLDAEQSRTYDVRVDQNILGNKLMLHGGYFHAQFDHGVEPVSAAALQQYFGIGTAPSLTNTAFVNSLAYRAQGGELEVEYQPVHRVVLRGGYTFLAPVVERSFTNDALQTSGSTTNPALPGVTIGATSPLVGARPFQRAPQTGFFVADYTRVKYAVGINADFAGRSDDSTFLAPTLLLPNRDLDHGYALLDVHATASVTSHAVAFVQLENLVNNQHVGPLGSPGLPLTVRAGLKIRIGGD